MTKPVKVERGRDARAVSRRNLQGAALDKAIYLHEKGAFERICVGINTPRSLACYMLAQANEWQQYLDLPPAYHDDDFPLNHGVTEMMRKNPRLAIDVDRKQAALDKFVDSELHCAEVNARFSEYPINALGSSVPNHLQTLDRDIKQMIGRVLGPLTGDKLGFSERKFRFGPGATSDVNGKYVLLSNKMSKRKFGITPRLSEFRNGLLWAGASCRAQNYSKVTTVPKTCLTDRTIAIEPHWNSYVQNGVGALLRKQLVRFGLNVNTQDENRAAAMIARDKGLATVDLSSASDTISSLVVSHLIPDDWFRLLYVARTDYALLPDGRLVELEKFSSMGNGFTWELETLIFYCIAYCSARQQGVDVENVLAFGDDIVIPAAAYGLLVEALTLYGFKVNSKKSFWQGDFFESCGVDVFRGHDVRPFYFRGENHYYETSIIKMANAVRIYAHRIGRACIKRDRAYYDAYKYLVRNSERGQLTGIPIGYGTSDGLIKSLDEFNPVRWKHQWCGWRGAVLHSKSPISPDTDAWGSLNGALKLGAAENPLSQEAIRGRLLAPRLRPMFCNSWDELDPWST